MEKKRHVFDIKLNSITDTDNPTRKECEFILHDFDVSHNNAFISKETALKTLHTLKDMPIVCKYYPVSESGQNDDSLGDHGVYLDKDRESGELMLGLNTTPIGVFTESAYITTVKDNLGNEKEVVAGKGILWASRFPNAIGLLKEWKDSGVEVVSSMEILYDSFLFKDGVEEILSYIYEGHCVLNSEDRGNHAKVYPAYDVSKLTKLVAQAINQEKESKEVEEMEEKQSLQEVEEISEEVVVEQQEENQYTNDENQELENEEIKSLQNEVNDLKNSISLLEGENKSLQEKFNEATEKLTQLNSQVEELKPFKDQVEQEKLEKALNEKKEFYSAKFKALNAVDKFDSEEVQELVKKSINETDEGKQAILQLNTMLVEMVVVEKEVKTEDTVIRELSSKRENLIPTGDDFESRYSN